MSQNFPDNSIYLYDNLEVMRGMNSMTIDLIATDPPYNTGANKEDVAGVYMDNWHWSKEHDDWLSELLHIHPPLYHVISSFRKVEDHNIAAFGCFMAVRLIEMHRLLKPDGSLFLQCDYNAVHLIRCLLTSLFGKHNFVNQIVWQRNFGQNTSKNKFSNNVDYILYYRKSNVFKWNRPTMPRSKTALASYKYQDERGRYKKESCVAPKSPGRETFWRGHTHHWRHSEEKREEMVKKGEIILNEDGTVNPRNCVKSYLNDVADITMRSLWTDINQRDPRTGWPTQKPVSLYQRIIEAASLPDELILDPFCGSGTTLVAAKNTNRRWIGIEHKSEVKEIIVQRMMGITKKEAERCESLDAEWYNKQRQLLDINIIAEPPVRDDITGQQLDYMPDTPRFRLPKGYELHTNEEMKDELIKIAGLKCWGCNMIPPNNDKRQLVLDHDIPRSLKGSDNIDNMTLLCSACNSSKGDTRTLQGLRQVNKQRDFLHPNEPVDLAVANSKKRELYENARDNAEKQGILQYHSDADTKPIVKGDKQQEANIERQQMMDIV